MSSGFVGRVGQRADRRVGADGGETPGQGQGTVVLNTEWAWIAIRARPGDHVSRATDGRSGRTVAVVGTLVDTAVSPPRVVHARDVLAEGRELDPARLRDFDGSYQLLVLDEHRRTVRLIGDHLGSRPLFFDDDPAAKCFGRSEDEVVALAGRRPSLSQEGAIGFLALGFPIGGRTLIDGVRRLRPARELVLDGEGRCSERRWWDLSFAQVGPTRLDDAVDQLHELGMAAHRAVRADGAQLDLALTGGYDSRLVLAMLRETDLLPEGAFTWSSRPGVPGSDPEIAAALAEIAGVPHRSLHYGPETFASRLDAWIRLSALRSDNLGHVCAGATFLHDEGLEPRPVLLGDHVLGLGAEFASRNDAIASVLRVPWPGLSRSLAALLPMSELRHIQATLRDQVEAILAESDATQPKDVHHYLYFHVGVFDWLLAPGYYKEPVLEARRPLAGRALLDAAASWPAALRRDKRVAVTLLRRRYKDLHAVPVADRSALVDWPAAMRSVPSLRHSLGSMLDDAAEGRHPLLAELRTDELNARFEALQHAPARSGHRRVRAAGVRLRRALGGVPALGAGLRHLERVARRVVADDGDGSGDLRQLFRVGLLARYERLLDDEPDVVDTALGVDSATTDARP